MKALSIVSGILTGLLLIATIADADLEGLVGVAFWGAICYFAMKKAKDPERKERIRAKKAKKAAGKAAKKEQRAEAQKQKEFDRQEAERLKLESTLQAGGRKAEKMAKKIAKEAERKERQAIADEEWKRVREANRLERERKQRERIRDNTPVAAVVITAQDKTKTSGGLGSAVVGGMIAGPVGAVVGASVGKKKTQVTGQRVTFSVKYESGRTGVETVDVTSKRFSELSALLMK